ncbi:CDP-diacylglycerol--inositol 3-phosphatidyltransferase-like [Physella acuta]|uniref:CDP-diacylglycerol--inositol 3-phosphatidyltransferase-like n=1 Tax=Physella acuta TaxID=109671 RepID=UPI0027DD3409|nr:CDP-diacylglycerol--inositol 3-phosphatidyltransferase-like [Physella acuta]XP_059171896.1 CDP-diacylglycerol--inositol 3-phosphatidyltransferase-like [Physella acuta]XP_059171897.1 CDP-diacylglycerol--inositol 3-phosphatidyltransferase-like [Physella acuta]XP_059171899.1 CDP-diacylglycerol--inositol 3-phosphatidyltransferase-like [Physella acuta]XP_059171900.1 CDP-diacylglycerol--inositol 3-phosphatidyltransferase-like [Physella acuta]XP_059171901.1 CDP-diacylglycerol--inositol 3-phosphati
MTENIYLFVPNIIDYLRILFAFISFYYMPTEPSTATAFYLLSGFLDAFDGHLARMLNQCSKLGAMLDQLTDRITTMCLCATLCHLYPNYMLFFQFAMALDIFSHWMHCQSAVQRGSTSHKKIDLSANPILRYYYHSQAVLFTMCAANELFFCMLYLNYFSTGPIIPIIGVGLWKLIWVMCFPLAVLKMLISCIQLGAACENYAIMDREDRSKQTTGQTIEQQKKLE